MFEHAPPAGHPWLGPERPSAPAAEGAAAGSAQLQDPQSGLWVRTAWFGLGLGLGSLTRTLTLTLVHPNPDANPNPNPERNANANPNPDPDPDPDPDLDPDPDPDPEPNQVGTAARVRLHKSWVLCCPGPGIKIYRGALEPNPTPNPIPNLKPGSVPEVVDLE